MFRGMFEHTIDPKGRTSLPSRFREVLAGQDARERLVITAGLDPCLVAYPASEWEAFETKLSALPRLDPAVIQLKRIYVAGAIELSLDGHGRLMIPPLLREHARLTRDVVWAGMVSTIELWSKEAWAEQARVSRQDHAAIAQMLGRLGL